VKVLVVGGEGKEHAIVWKLSQSRHVDRIYCCPGNAGIAEIAECIDVNPHDDDALVDFVKYEWIDLTIVSTKEPLSKGLVDSFEKGGCKVFGPNRVAAQLGSSKVFAKDFMRLYRIPTAEYKVFTSYLYAEDYVRLKGAPLVIRTDEPVEGCNTYIALTVEEAIEALKIIMKDRDSDNTNRRVIIEEELKGEEISCMAFTDGKVIVPLAVSKKYRRIFDDDTGPVTEGMGAYSPVLAHTKELETLILRKILQPALKALNSEGLKYKGVFSSDILMKNGNPYVLGLDCTFFDPEIQAVFPRLKADFMEIALAITDERLSDIQNSIEWSQDTSVCIVVSSMGYPDKSQNGLIISGLEKIKNKKDIIVFHSHTRYDNSKIVTSGGRVLSVSAIGANIKDAREKAYRALKEINFKGMHYRTNIGEQELHYEKDSRIRGFKGNNY
jgi:phosphoribosylamine--glycine ligase